MTYEEACAEALKVKWRVVKCHQQKCWCATIFPDCDFEIDEDIPIVSAGSMRREYAEHIVRLHNESLNRPASKNNNQ